MYVGMNFSLNLTSNHLNMYKLRWICMDIQATWVQNGDELAAIYTSAIVFHSPVTKWHWNFSIWNFSIWKFYLLNKSRLVLYMALF